LLRWAAIGVFAAAMACQGVAQEPQQAPVKPALDPVPVETREPVQNPQPAPAFQPPAPVAPIRKVAPALPQEPTSSAQVQTGSKIGEGALLNLANRLAALLGDHQFQEMQELLDASDSAPSDAPGKLAPEKAQLYRGILANRDNKPQESIKLLEPLVAGLKPGGDTGHDPAEEKLMRKTLAEDYLRAGEWSKAAEAYKSYAANAPGGLTPEEKDELELPLALTPLAAGNPPMTVELGDAFALPYDRDALGLTDVPVFIDGQSHDWMLDATSAFNLICRSTAKFIGLKISEQSAIVQSLTGKPMKVHATLIPRFTIGTVTYRNMTAFVFDDADYYFPASHYQVRGVLGYPAISALGSITVTANAQIEVQPGEKGDHLTAGARFYLDGDRVIVELGKTGRPEEERAFVVDVAGQRTYLSSRYFAENTAEFADQKMKLVRSPGAEDKPPVPVYQADSISLDAGGMPLNLNSIEVLTEPLGNAAVDDTYGTLGIDALDELKSYTFDYRTMRFGVRSQQGNF
jgi:Aspartyl protease